MTKKQFLALADKFEQGLCSEKEEVLLYKFCEQAQFKSIVTSWDLSEESKIRIQLLKKIQQTIKIEQQNRHRFRWKHIRNLAGILVFLGVCGYIYFQQSNSISQAIPEDAITLQLEDGSLQIINEKDSSSISNKAGKVIGRHEGTRMLYMDTSKTTRIVYNTLRVPYGKKFEIELSDGTVAYLNSGTSIKYPSRFLANTNREIYITGEAFLAVAKDSSRPFIVNTDQLEVKVLGTKFNVFAYPEDEVSAVTLVEGAVSLQTAKNTSKNKTVAYLKPGFRGSLSKTENEITTEQVNTTMYTSWRDGKLVFRNMIFKNIIKKLERHYNVKINNKNEELAGKKFNMNFGNESLEGVLDGLKANYGIQYAKDYSGNITIQ
ncbi:FecR family protein [Zunongwangia endophytica]|uniref:FecR family protein n=1 Tax=Zunongwangia endophytica TaxID=1808945 RepID=A0ABV8HF48_9FLAO|nr:FecR domain-containing protein [Zunongwangia endophytica]MDN3593907.1 DUF4974 domain-containing protein [Zunongwangia endophytica]